MEGREDAGLTEGEQSDDTLEPSQCTCQCTCQSTSSSSDSDDTATTSCPRDHHNQSHDSSASFASSSAHNDYIDYTYSRSNSQRNSYALDSNNTTLELDASRDCYKLNLCKLATMNQHTDWHKMWNPRASMSFNSAKGLLNEPGQNNCFLNSAVQVLWHMDAFRRSFRLLSGHACMGNSCIFCALKVIFTQFQYSDQSALPPDALRRALARTFRDQQRFQLNLMDDAAECFENILTRIHFHIANGESEDMCNARHCIPHQKFSMTIVEQVVCQHCKVSSEPNSFSQTVHYVSASALVGQHKSMSSHMRGPVPDHMFGQILRTASSQGDTRDCPGNCGRRVLINRSLTNCPDVVSIGVIWDSDRPSLEHIKDVVRSIGTIIRLRDLFDHVVDEYSKSAELHLVGVVCYYGKHYSTFFFHSKMKKWISFDDANVKEMGSQWCTVAEKCCRGHYQPLLLLYSIENAQPIDVETAPPSTVMLPGYNFGKDASIPEEGSHSRQSSSSDRSRTVGGHSSTSGAYNYDTTALRNGPNLSDKAFNTEPYNPQYSGAPGTSSSSSAPHRRSVTPDPDRTLKPGHVSSNRVLYAHPESTTTTSAPQWGRYHSDDDDDGNGGVSSGVGKLEITHNRQPSYLSALDAVDGSGGGGSGGHTAQEECTCGISSQQHKVTGNNDNNVLYTAAGYNNGNYSTQPNRPLQQGYSCSTAAPASSGHYGQNTGGHYAPQYSQLGKPGQMDLLGSIPPQQYSNNNNSSNPYSGTNYGYNQSSGGYSQYPPSSSAPVSRSNSQCPMTVDDMVVHRSHLRPSHVDPNATNLKRVKSMENSLGVDPEANLRSSSSSVRPQSARPAATVAPGTRMQDWLDGDGDDYGTYINRKSVQSVMNKLQQNPAAAATTSTRLVKDSPSLKLDIPDTASLGSASLKDSGYRSGGSGGDRNSAASSMESPTVDPTPSYKTVPCSSSSLSLSSYSGMVNKGSVVPSRPPINNNNPSSSSSTRLASTATAAAAANVPTGTSNVAYPSHVQPHATAGHQALNQQRPPLPPSTGQGGVSGGANNNAPSSKLAGGNGETQTKSVRELAKALEKQNPLPHRPPSPSKQPSKPRLTSSNPSSISDDSELQRLCLQSEGLVENSVQKEAEGDLHAALGKCTQAIAVLQGALGRPGREEGAAVHLRMKLNAAVLRSRGLHKRICQQPADNSTPTEGNEDKMSISSSNSTDTGERFAHNNSRDLISLESAADQKHQQLKSQVKQLYQNPPGPGNGFTGRCPPQKHPPGTQQPLPPPKPSVQPKPTMPHTHITAFDDSSLQSAAPPRRKFTSDYVSREEYFANHPPPPNKQVPGLRQMHKSATDSALSSRAMDMDKSRPKIPPKPPARTTSIDSKPMDDEGKDSDNGLIDIYATLPRKGKKARSSTLNGNQQAEVYQAYLDRQKQQQGEETGGGGMKEDTGLVVSHTRQLSKEEIRDILYKDFVHKGKEGEGEKPKPGHRRHSSNELLDINRQQYSSSEQQQQQQYPQHNQNQPPAYQKPQQAINHQQAPPPQHVNHSQYHPGPAQHSVNQQAVQPQRQFCEPVSSSHPFVTDRKVNYDPTPLTGVPTVDIQTDNVRPSVIDKLDKIYSKQGTGRPHPQQHQQQQQPLQNGMYPPANVINNTRKSSTTSSSSSSQGYQYTAQSNGAVRPPSDSSSSNVDVTSSNPAETTTVSKPGSESPSKSPTPIKTSAHYVPPPVAPPTMGLPMDPPPTLAQPNMPSLYLKSQLQEDSSTFTDSNYSSNDRTDTQSDTSASTGSRRIIVPAKPALVKKKRKSHRPRKNVTFSDHVALIAATEQEATQVLEKTDYMKYVSDLLNNSKKAKQKSQSQELTSCLKSRAQTPVVANEKDLQAKTGYDSDFDENTSDSCTSDETQTDKVRCNLCRKKLIEMTEMYCSDCTYYMSQFQPTTQA